MPEDEEIVEEEIVEEEMPEEEEEVVEEEMTEQAEEGMAEEENLTEEEMAEENISEEEMAEEEMNISKVNILETAQLEGNFDTFATAVQTAELEDTLMGEGPYTVFAPTDEAIEALPSEMRYNLRDEEELTDVLLYHMAEGELDITEIESIETMQGGTLTVDPTSDPITVGNANIIGDRIETSNGFIYPIDAVLFPPE